MGGGGCKIDFYTQEYAVRILFCLRIQLPTPLCPLSTGYLLNVLNAIADIMNIGIFENEIGKTAMSKTLVCNPAKHVGEITIVKTNCLYNGLITTFPERVLILCYLDPALSLL